MIASKTLEYNDYESLVKLCSLCAVKVSEGKTLQGIRWENEFLSYGRVESIPFIYRGCFALPKRLRKGN